MSAHAVWHDNSTWPPSLGVVAADAVVARHIADRRLFESAPSAQAFTLPVGITLRRINVIEDVAANSSHAHSHSRDPCGHGREFLVLTPEGGFACLSRTYL